LSGAFAQSPKRIVIFSGTFDLPHLGHVEILRNAQEAVDADLALVMTNVFSDHKSGISSFAQRKEMAQMTFGPMPGVTLGRE